MFGQNMLLHRRRLGISQEELAELSALHRTYIGDVERGKRNIGLENIIKIAVALQTTASELLTGVGPNRKVAFSWLNQLNAWLGNHKFWGS